MTLIAYLANAFPSPVESYVGEEIQELRRCGVDVIACSARQIRPRSSQSKEDVLNLLPLRLWPCLQAVWLGARSYPVLRKFFRRIVLQGDESASTRIRGLAHTFLGVYYAVLLRRREVKHIHVHHGYFSAWIGMVAARLLGAGFSMTLHGSDLLLGAAYIETKLVACDFCFTISEFNREYIRHAYPSVNLHKVFVQRLGVDLRSQLQAGAARGKSPFTILTVGRLHKVKDHAFLVRACREFRDRGNHFACVIAGAGPEESALREQIGKLKLEQHVYLLGHVSKSELERYYSLADVIVLTSRSEGIPVALMEAMAHGKVVLAPAITGIPELVIDGLTGFLYRAGSLEDFVSKLEFILESLSTLEPIRREAKRHVAEHYDRDKNLAQFTATFLSHVALSTESLSDAHPVLQ